LLAALSVLAVTHPETLAALPAEVRPTPRQLAQARAAHRRHSQSA
jgi:hypothetical protein